jgi:hypothetical protein
MHHSLEAGRPKRLEGHSNVSFLGTYMRRVQFTIILLVSLTVGLSLAVPPEDVPETVYDESETLPYKSSPRVSIVVPLGAARTTQVAPSSSHHKLVAPSPFLSAHARLSLALLCTLLC